MRPRRLIITPTARRSLQRIQQFIALRNRPRSITFVAEFRTHLKDCATKRVPGNPRHDLGPLLRAFNFHAYIALAYATDVDLRIVRVTRADRSLPNLPLEPAPPGALAPIDKDQAFADMPDDAADHHDKER